jgi:hypothetical protein
VREKVLLPLINEGKDAIVLMHSFGGVYGGAAARGLSKAQLEREAKKGGVVALVYMAAACVPSGMSTLERMGVGEELLPWVELDVCNLSKTLFCHFCSSLSLSLLLYPDLTAYQHHRNPPVFSGFQIPSRRCSTTCPPKKPASGPPA